MSDTPLAPDSAGQRALITGAGSGIGLALAQALKAAGWTIALTDRDSPAARAAANSLQAAFFPADLTDPAAPHAIVDWAWRTLGGLDLVCSNAGMARNKRLKREPLHQEAQALFEVNSFAAVRLAQALLEKLESEGGRARLLITASENSLSVPAAVKTFGLGLYAASKHALLALAEWMQIELAQAQSALSIHVLLPGPVYSPPMAAAIPDPSAAPPAFHLISCETCAAIALEGLRLGLFYIPTHAHLIDDMTWRSDQIRAAVTALALERP